jgi:pyruvate dehydrogenase E2 component (dihydrolipoamide acetyltransferase)
MMRVAVPDIGDFKDVAVIEVLIGIGDSVAKDQTLVVLESDKASVDIPSSAAGIVTTMSIKVGDRVSTGSPLLTLQSVDSGRATERNEPKSAKDYGPDDIDTRSAEQALSVAGQKMTKRVYAGPSVRKTARELGVDLQGVSGSGPRGRIVNEDVRARAKVASPVGAARHPERADAEQPLKAALTQLPWPRVDYAKFGPIEKKLLSRIQQITGAALHRDWVTIPHVTNHDHADVTDLESFRAELNRETAKRGAKVSPLAFVVKACVAALKVFPQLNASLEGDALILKRYYHIGFAADTAEGLLVPVIRDADAKGILQIAEEMADLSGKARAGKLPGTSMQGGSFSISSLGGIGGSHFTPIINAPEVAILGVGRTETRVTWADEQPRPRSLLPLSLSWDHRAVDGATASRFLAHLVSLLGDLRRLLL